MKKSLILICLFGLISCSTIATKKDKSVEVWKSEFIRIKSSKKDYIDNLKTHTQYLLLYANGNANLIDSLENGTVLQSKTNWEIRKRNGRNVFLFGYGEESKGILGVAYPIRTKNETDFKMLFDTLTETHVWNLKRIK